MRSAVLGLNGPTGNSSSFNAARAAGVGGINGKTLTFTSFNGGAAVNVTFGDGTGGTVKTLDQLNATLQANNLAATLELDRQTDDLGHQRLRLFDPRVGGGGRHDRRYGYQRTVVLERFGSRGRRPGAGCSRQPGDPVQQRRWPADHDDVEDASFNGVNLLGGDTLKLTFNETGKSTLSITGVNFNAAGLGLANLTSRVDFIDNSATNKVVSSLASASTLLRSQASALGSNLSIVQIRQDFSKNVINVLQTGSSNLTLADTNAEAANSQALSTRQSIAVSALSLANQSQQSVLQLLR